MGNIAVGVDARVERVLEALARGNEEALEVLASLVDGNVDDVVEVASKLLKLEISARKVVAPVIARSDQLAWEGLQRVKSDSDVLQLTAQVKSDSDVLQDKSGGDAPQTRVKSDSDVLQGRAKSDSDVLQGRAKSDSDVLQLTLKALSILGKAEPREPSRSQPAGRPLLKALLEIADHDRRLLPLLAAFVRFHVTFTALIRDNAVFSAMKRLRQNQPRVLEAVATLAIEDPETLTALEQLRLNRSLDLGRDTPGSG